MKLTQVALKDRGQPGTESTRQVMQLHSFPCPKRSPSKLFLIINVLSSLVLTLPIDDRDNDGYFFPSCNAVVKLVSLGPKTLVRLSLLPGKMKISICFRVRMSYRTSTRCVSLS